jgi:hypothetical protein
LAAAGVAVVATTIVLFGKLSQKAITHHLERRELPIIHLVGVLRALPGVGGIIVIEPVASGSVVIDQVLGCSMSADNARGLLPGTNPEPRFSRFHGNVPSVVVP